MCVFVDVSVRVSGFERKRGVLVVSITGFIIFVKKSKTLIS